MIQYLVRCEHRVVSLCQEDDTLTKRYKNIDCLFKWKIFNKNISVNHFSIHTIFSIKCFHNNISHIT
jgi:hypothetical protein